MDKWDELKKDRGKKTILMINTMIIITMEVIVIVITMKRQKIIYFPSELI